MYINVPINASPRVHVDFACLLRICMIVRARKVGRKWKYAIRGTIWKSLLSFSLSFSEWGDPFLTFCLASLAFRPIPTCFRIPIQSLISFIPILSFSLDALSLATLSLHSTWPWITRANCVAAYSNCHVNLIKSDKILFNMREGRRFFLLRFMPSYATKESVENFIKVPRVRYARTRVILVCDKLSVIVEK